MKVSIKNGAPAVQRISAIAAASIKAREKNGFLGPCLRSAPASGGRANLRRAAARLCQTVGTIAALR